ncbi:chitin synthase activator [Coccidioides immitis RS]|uniref:Chitin synthase activator n=2 Tax=Coccidioides immitis TaxID=5501 RepID=J3K657_COCIM|nr:chitin synthase activator [Coccidioides immitis RS]EAS30023.3 chitin synthase activator [Coccidioides immitis RS]KMP06980.1 SKT5 protein [Coccidioides immitis RMSCC 2394]
MSRTAELQPPLSPPEPAYLRSSAPFPSPDHNPPPPPPPLMSPKNSSKHVSRLSLREIPKRKPVGLSELEAHESAVMHHSPVSPVRIDDPSIIPEASSALVEDVRNLRLSQESGNNYSYQEYPPRRSSLYQSPPPAQYSQDQHGPMDDTSGIPPRGDSLNHAGMPQQFSHLNGQGRQVETRSSSSRNSLESFPEEQESTQGNQEPEIYQPLQYHHQPFQEHLLDRVGHRGSKSTIISASDSSSTGGQSNNLAPGGLVVPRPPSAYSDGRGRTRSLQLSPYGHARAVSSHSAASPDTRPLSFVDLMNVPYPQPPPAPATLSNAHLRASVGNSASLLSHKQTFEMYLANVKKTNDSGAQYEFAVFMIHAAQEASRPDSPAASKQQEIGSDISKAELLREAKAILQRLADRSYPYAQYYLGDGYASGLFNKGKPDYDKAFPLFVAASKHGHAEAGYRAALCYEFGWGSRKDGAKAVQFYRQAASKNHPGAMLRLGKACLTGDMGLSKRYREGITWLKRATESADFQYNAGPYELGLLHETGYGDDVFQDESYAAQLLTKSAELGHAESNYRLGDAYEHGKLSCPRDPALSVHFYTGAAQLGHPMAMMALCAWFMVGAEPMLEKDEYEAYEWAKKAAECGLAKAEYAVGYFTEMGIGCRRDPLEANVWYVRAADHGDERAKHRIAAIRAAASGADPKSAARRTHGKIGKPDPATQNDKGKGKKFGLF